ncbi:spore protease YyaC [Brevibacillus massiliensis]|jgi:putative sporulation protein YyaC|uniref:spore protease YyaC n=1 Tax=Brevibacillus massiliensis TaxID=1118054 RepID=UPI00031AF668|nr:spore protease YyaC [Brevibacillus massiliensis]
MNLFDDSPHSASVFKIEYKDEKAGERLSHHLMQRFLSKPLNQEIVILCIGTDRSTGDSLGPIVGTKLQSYSPKYLHIYGTLEDPVHAVNLADKIEHISRIHKDSLIIAVDACLGQFSNVGSIQVVDGPLKPGAGVKKDLPAVGTFHITGIVNVGGFMEYFVLQNTRLYVVMQMAEVIASGLHHASHQLHHRNTAASPYPSFSTEMPSV